MTTSPYYNTDRHEDGFAAAKELRGLLRSLGLRVQDPWGRYCPWAFRLLGPEDTLTTWAGAERPSLLSFLRQGSLVMEASKLTTCDHYSWFLPDLSWFAWTTRTWLEAHTLTPRLVDGRWDKERPNQVSRVVDVPVSAMLTGNTDAFLSFVMMLGNWETPAVPESGRE